MKITALAYGAAPMLLGQVKWFDAIAVVAVGLVTAGIGVNLELEADCAARTEEQPKQPEAKAPVVNPREEVDDPNAKVKVTPDRFGDPLPAGARLRLGTERFRRAAYNETPIAIFPNGKHIASFGAEALLLLDAKSGRVVNRKQGDGNKGFYDLAVSPDSKRIATVGYLRDGVNPQPISALQIWDAQSLVEIKTIRWVEQGRPTKVIFINEKIAATAEDKEVRLWDLEGTEELPRRAIGGASALAVSPDGSAIAIGAAAGKIHLWEWRTKNEPKQLKRDASRGPLALAFSPDGKTLAVSEDSEDGVSLWGLDGNKKLSLPHDATRRVRRMAFTPDGKCLITPESPSSAFLGGKGGVLVWDAATGKEIRFLATPGSGANGVMLSQDGALLAASAGSTIHVWDTKTWKALSTDETAHRGNVTNIAVSKNGQILTGSDDHTARLWDLKDGKLIQTFECREWVRGVAITQDGSRAAALSTPDEMFVWDTATGKTIYKLPGHGPYGQHSVGISDDGRRLLSFGTNDLYLRVTDLANGKAIAEHAIRPQGIDIDPNADSERGRLARGLIGRGTFTPDGKYMLLTANGEFRVIDVASGKELHRLGRNQFHRFAVSADSSLLLTAQAAMPIRDENGRAIPFLKSETVRIIKIENGELIGSLAFKDGGIRNFAAAPDGRHFAVAVAKPKPQLHFCVIGEDKPVKSFDLGTTPFWAMTYTPDGKSLALSMSDTSVLVFDIPVVKSK